MLVIAEGFGRDIRTGRTAPVQVIISGDNANTATTVLGYASSILRTANEQLSPGMAEVVAPLSVEPRIWYNPELRTAVFVVPGPVLAITTPSFPVARE